MIFKYLYIFNFSLSLDQIYTTAKCGKSVTISISNLISMTGSMSGNLQNKKQVMPSVTKEWDKWRVRGLEIYMSVCIFACVCVCVH